MGIRGKLYRYEIDLWFRFCIMCREHLYAIFPLGCEYRFAHLSIQNTPCYHWPQVVFMNHFLTVL